MVSDGSGQQPGGPQPGDTVRWVESFPADSRSVAAARRFIADALKGDPAELTEAVVLMVSELTTNAVRHVDSAFELTVERTPDEIRVEVRDHSSSPPRLQSPGPDELGGRGLQIVELLSDRWGVSRSVEGGKAVWFALWRRSGSRTQIRV